MNNTLTYFTTTGLTAALVVSGFFNFKLHQDFQITKNNWQNTQSQLMTAERELDRSQQEIAQAKDELEDLKIKAEIDQTTINNYQQQVNTVMTLFCVQQNCQAGAETIEENRQVERVNIAF